MVAEFTQGLPIRDQGLIGSGCGVPATLFPVFFSLSPPVHSKRHMASASSFFSGRQLALERSSKFLRGVGMDLILHV